MNCDQAFDVMTSSRRESDHGLHVHMAGCPRCREMRETLGPALNVLQADFDEIIAAEPCQDTTPSFMIASRAAQQLTPAVLPEMSRSTSLWIYAAAIVLSAGLVWCSIMHSPTYSNAPSISRSQTVCQYLSNTRPKGITGQQMTQSCLACHAATAP